MNGMVDGLAWIFVGALRGVEMFYKECEWCNRSFLFKVSNGCMVQILFTMIIKINREQLEKQCKNDVCFL